MNLLPSSRLLLLLYCLPLAVLASFKVVEGPRGPDLGSGVFCDESYVAFRDDNNGPPFKVINDTLYLFVMVPPLTFRVLYQDDEGRAVICTTVPPEVTATPLVIVAPDVPFSLPLFVIIYISTSLSIIGSVALLVTYSLFKQLRTLPGQVIMNLAAAFLAGDLLVQIRVAHEHHGIYHLASSALQNHLYLARFVWMTITGIEMSRSLYNGINLSYDSKCKSKILLAIYMAIGWGIPTLLAVIMVAVEYKGDENAREMFGVVGYMTNHVPLGISQLINISAMIFLSVLLWNASQRQKKLRAAKKQKINFVRIFLILLILMGLVWLAFFILLAWSTLVAIQITFVLLTIPQPLLVSAAFICTKKVYLMYRNLFGCGEREYDLKRAVRRENARKSNEDRVFKRERTATSILSSDGEIKENATSTIATIEEAEETAKESVENEKHEIISQSTPEEETKEYLSEVKMQPHMFCTEQ